MAGDPPPERPVLRFDDVDGINDCVTGELGPWGPSLVVDQDLIDSFADLSGDHQWIHVDPERCRTETGAGTTIAHGTLILALLPRLAPHAVTLVGQARSLNYGADRLRFVAPVPVGAAIQARSRLLRAERAEAGVLVTTEVHVHVVGVAKPAVVYHMQVLCQVKEIDET